MTPIDKKKIPVKYIVGFVENNPTYFDLLYELCSILETENKDEFNEWELKNKTKWRYPNFEENVEWLINNKYIAKTKYSKYTILKHPWI